MLDSLDGNSKPVVSPPHLDLLILVPNVLRFLKHVSGENSTKVLSEFTDHYLAEFSSLLQAIGHAIDLGEVDEARKLASSLKFSSSAFGAIRFSRACQDLEISVQLESTETCNEKFLLLKLEYDHLKSAVQQILSSDRI